MAEAVGDLIRRQARALAEIQKKPELEASLKRCDESLKLIQTSIESKRARAVAAKNEIYLLVSFYLVFQGGVMNSLASKANAQKCGFALFPAALSTLALVAVLVSVHDKFHDYHKMKNKLRVDESESRKLQYNIHMVLGQGGNFEFADVEVKAISAPEAAEAAMAAVTESARTSTESAGTSTELAGTSAEAAKAAVTESAGTSAEAAGTSTDSAGTSTETAGTSTASAGASSQAAKKWADKWFLHERRYFDVMGFLVAVFVIVLINSIFVC